MHLQAIDGKTWPKKEGRLLLVWADPKLSLSSREPYWDIGSFSIVLGQKVFKHAIIQLADAQPTHFMEFEFQQKPISAISETQHSE